MKKAEAAWAGAFPPALQAAAWGRWDDARSWVQAATRLPGGASHRDRKPRLLCIEGAIASHTQKTEDARAVLERAVAAAQESDDSAALGYALDSFARAYMHSTDIAAAKSCFASALEIAATTGDHQGRAAALLGLGWASLRSGEPAQAQALFVESNLVATEAADEGTLAETELFLGELTGGKGDAPAGKKRLERGLALARKINSPFHQTRAFAALGRIALGAGNLPGAARFFERACAIARETGFWFIQVRSLQSWSQTAIQERDVARATQLLEDSLLIARDFDDWEAAGIALFAMGRIARDQGYEDKATGLHHEALALRKHIGHRAGVAESLEAVAGLLAKNRPDTAARLLGAAATIKARSAGEANMEACPCCRQDRAAVSAALSAEQLKAAMAEGATLSADEAVAYATRGRGPRHATKVFGLESLTFMEREVAVLAARGLTNPEIGAKLYISPRTVGSHLARSYRKLGIKGRRQLRDAFPQD